MKKRALSWLLALTMLLTLAPQTLPVWASATGEKSSTATQTESKLSANTYSALGLSRNVDTSALPKGQQPYGKAEPGNTVATNVINELYVNFNGSIHYGWSILDKLTMEYKTGISDWTSSDNFYGAMGYWRPGQQTVHYKNGDKSAGALFAEDRVAGEHNGKSSINSANKHLTYQYSKSEAFSPNTGKDNYVAEMTINSASQVYLYIYQVEGGNKRYVRSTTVCDASESGGNASDKTNIIYNWEYDAMYDIAAGDMDGDGYDEIAVYAQNCVYVYSFEDGTLSELIKKETVKPEGVNEGGGKYKKLKTAVVTLAFGDLNADDKDELVIAENMTYGSSNPAKDNKVEIYALEDSKLTSKENITLYTTANATPFVNEVRIRYANVATGDIDGDYQDELIIAGYISANGNGQCSKENVAYMVVKGDSKNNFENSGWKRANHTIDLLDRVVDNKDQLIPPVALTCAATQGVGHAEQLFLGGWLYSVNLGTSKNLSDVTLTDLTQMSTNREYKKDNGNKANKEEIFVVNVVAGNFNGNRNGQEQIVYAFGMKHDDSDRYWYDIGYLNKKAPGPTDADQSSGYWYGQEQVMNYESSYNRDDNKARASLYLSLAAVDCDNDSTLMRYKGQTVTWTKPEVLTVLQSAPYFQDLEDTRGYLDQGQTGYGKGSSSSSSAIAGTSLKVGTYVSFEQDFSVFGVKVASIQAEAQSTHEFEYEFQSTKEKSIEVRYSGSAGDDYAVVYAVPYMEYQYETWVPGYTVTKDNLNTYIAQKLGKAEGEVRDTDRQKVLDEFGIKIGTTVEGSWQPSSVMVPMTPANVLITVDDYDAIAEQTEGLEPIRGNILNSTPGEPATYDAVGARSNDFHAIGKQQKVTTAEGGNVSLEATTTDTTAHTFAYNYEFEAKAGAGAGGVTVGVLAGLGTTAGGGVSSSQSNSYSATVDNLPKDASKYGFSWQFGWRNAKLNNNDVLVLEYQLDDVAQLPSMPKNLRVDSVTAESVTLKWDKVVGSGAYDIYQVSTTDPETKYFRARVPGTADSYTDTNVNPNNSYTYCVQNISQAGTKSIYSTTVKAITLTDANGSFVIKQQPGDKDNSIQTYVGGTATATIEAEYLKNGEPKSLSYIWQQYDTATKKWVSCSSGYGERLELSNVTEDMDGTKYRCQVLYDANLYIYTDPVTLTIGKANSATTLESNKTNQTVNASYVKTETVTTGKTTGPLKETINDVTYLVYTKGNDITVYMKDGTYYSKNANNTVTELEQTPENVQLTYVVKTTTSATGDQPATETVEEKNILFSKMEKDETFNASEANVTYVYQAEPKNTSGDGEGSTDSESTAETYTATEKYIVTDNNDVVVYHCQKDAEGETPAIDFWFVQSGDNKYAADVQTATKLKIGNDYVDINDLVQATMEVPVVKTEEIYKEGDKVTLTATPSDQSQPELNLTGKVVFKIVNSIGDGSKTVDATIGDDGKATAEWIPTAAGVYTITAAYEGNEKYMGSVSSQTITINVVVPEQKTLMIDSPNSMTYGDAAIELKTTLLKGAKNSESASVETNLSKVTYSVKNADGTEVSTGSTFDPTAAGTYTVTATYTTIGSETLTATKSIVVNKRTVTIVPKVEGTGTTKTATYSLANCMTSDESLFTNKIQVTCAGTAPNAVAGEYPYTVTYTPGENEAAINSKYIVVIDTMHPYVLKDDMVTVTDKTSSNNGTVTLRYRSSSTDSYVDVYGDSVPKNAEVIAVASPKAGYRVKQWKVNGQRITTGQDGALNTAQTITVASSATKDYTVEAEFELVYHTLSFEVKNESGQATGTVTAKYLKDSVENGTFVNGKEVSYFDRVRLTANVDAGQSVKEWQITRNNGTTETLKIDNEVYTGNSYVLSSITADTKVTVVTEDQTNCTVTVHLVNKDGEPLTGGQVSFNGELQDTDNTGTFTYSGHKNDDLTVALTLPSGLVVEEWLRKDDETNTSSALQIGSFSNNKTTWHVVNLPTSLDLTVKCVTPNSCTITKSTTVQDGTGSETGGTIEVYQIGKNPEVTSVLQGSDLLVKVNPANGYQLLDVTCNGTSQMSQMGTGNEFRINGVNENIIIMATFVKKPVVTIENADAAKGAVTVTGTVNGQSGTPNPYADYQTALEILLKPQVGYVVEGIKLNDGTQINTTDTKFQNAGGDDYKYITDALTADVKITPVWHKLSEYTVTFSIDTTGDGEHGSLTASVSRKAADGYVHAGYAGDNFTSNNKVYDGSDVTFTAAPATGYCVQEWKVNGEVQKDNGLNITANTLTLSNITEVKTVTVQFMQVGSKVTAAAGSNGSITSGKVAGKDVDYTGGFTLAENAQATFTAQPDTGYEVDQWLVNGSNAQSGGTTFNYTAASGNTGAAITVIFRQIEYQVKWTAEHGTVTVSGHTGESATIRGGEELSFTASPADGYTLIDWKVNGERQNSHATSFQWTVPNGAAMSPAVSTFVIEPVFSRGTYAVTITKPDHSSITANKQNLSAVTGGEEVTFTAAPEDGYILIGWTVNGTTTNTRALTHKVEVNEVTTVTAVIVPSHYAITYQADNSANGTVSVEGHTENPVSVAYGENITFKAEPKNYYHVAGWKVDDTMQPNSANKDTFTLENVTATQTVTAVFGEAVRYTVSYQVEGGNGSLSAKAGGENLTLNPDQTTPVLGGTKLVFTAAPNNDYMVKEWKIDSNTVEGNLSNKLEIGSLEKKTIVTVSFEPLKLHTITANGTECEIKDVIRTPSDYGDDTHVRDRGTVSFKVVPTKASMGLQGLPENAKVVYNSDGSYTVTVTNVTSDISFQMKEYQAKTGNLQIPSEYTESTLKSALRKQIHSSVSGSDIAYLDIKLQIKTRSNPDVWEDVTSANFPQGGIDITILYSALGQSGLDSSYNYSVAHMLENGTVENLSAKGGTSGVTFHVNSLSPFAIGWYKNTPTPGGGGGGGGAVSTYTLTFDTNGGSAIDKITKDSGTTIDLATYKPTRAGYTFAGWFSDKALTKAVTSVKLTANTTVYAKWTQNGGTAQNPFVDVKEGAYYYDAVLWAVEKGVTSGTSATTFSPDATVTRGQTVTFLYRNAGSPEVSGTMPFADVEADAYYAKAVQWAVQQKITTGTSETTFSPMSDCTRGQIVTFLYRAK